MSGYEGKCLPIESLPPCYLSFGAWSIVLNYGQNVPKMHHFSSLNADWDVHICTCTLEGERWSRYHGFTAQVQCGGELLISGNQSSEPGPPQQVGDRIAVGASLVPAPEQLRVVVTPTQQRRRRRGAARTCRGEAWHWGGSGPEWECWQSRSSLESLPLLPGLQVEVVPGLQAWRVGATSRVWRQVNWTTPRSCCCSYCRAASHSQRHLALAVRESRARCDPEWGLRRCDGVTVWRVSVSDRSARDTLTDWLTDTS